MYLVKKGDSISSLLYVGITSSLCGRFRSHKYTNIFINQTNLQRAIFFKEMSKDVAALIESLLILSSQLNKNLLNKQYETRNLQQLKDPKEAFNTKVFFVFLFL